MSWITPLGLPVMQPYRKTKKYEVSTVLQSITLVSQKENLPVDSRKQKTAFPPNFVHSLDASHMLITAMRMKAKNLKFAAVHDSYWTYASDIPIMAEVCISVPLFLRPCGAKFRLLSSVFRYYVKALCNYTRSLY